MGYDCRLVLVEMARVGEVPVAFMEVVHVAVVLDGFVATAITVQVVAMLVMDGVDGRDVAFVPVPFVLKVGVALVQIVGVAGVRGRCVATGGGVRVLVASVGRVCGGHDSSMEWASASWMISAM